MRKPTKTELQSINDWFSKNYDFTPTEDYIGIVDNYMPDGPAWTGKAAMFFGGEIEFVNVVLFARGTDEITHAMLFVRLTQHTKG